MSQNDRPDDFQWLLDMIALEEERGPIIPGGAVGGVVAAARRRASGKPRPPAAIRARSDVRFLARAISLHEGP